MASRHFVRAFSTSGATLQQAAAQSVKPPVAVFGIEGRYASALYSAAAREKKLDAVEKDLQVRVKLHFRGPKAFSGPLAGSHGQYKLK